MTPYAQKLLDRKAASPRPPQSCVSAAPARPIAAVPIPAIPAALANYPERMTARQVGEYLAISEDQVMLFRDKGEMDFIQVGCPGAERPAWRITRESVAAFERSRQTASAK